MQPKSCGTCRHWGQQGTGDPLGDGPVGFCWYPVPPLPIAYDLVCERRCYKKTNAQHCPCYDLKVQE